MNTETTTQLPLPYEALGPVAPRAVKREFMKPMGEMYWCPFRIIKTRPGFNGRIKPPGMSDEDYFNNELKIPELAEQILRDGISTPFEGDLLLDGTAFVVNDGHRRTMAVQYIIDNNLLSKDLSKTLLDKNGRVVVPVVTNPADFTEQDRVRRMFTANDSIPFRPLEMALKIMLMKYSFGYSNAQISEEWGRSRQWVDNMVALAQMPKDMQDRVELKAISLNQALAEFRAEKKQDSLPTPPEEPTAPLSTETYESGLVDAGEQMGNVPTGESLISILPAYGYDEPLTELAGYKAAMHIIHSFNSIESEHSLEDLAFIGKLLKLTSDFEEHMAGLSAADTGNYSPGMDLDGPAFQPFKPIKYDSESVHDQEEEITGTPTDPKFREKRPKKDQDDALGEIDFSKDKEMGEFELNEVMKMLDKAIVKMDQFPKAQQQHINDVQGWLRLCQSKVTIAMDIIKKASDKR